MIHDKSIIVGACDWQHENWLGNFYPDDLPEDWRLSFYANEFSVVLVPEIKWRAEGVGFKEWADEVTEGFQFYFLSTDINVVDAQIKAQIRKELGSAFGGFVIAQASEDVALIQYQTRTLRQWKDWLLTAQCKTIFLVDDDLSTKQLTEFQSLLELMGL